MKMERSAHPFRDTDKTDLALFIRLVDGPDLDVEELEILGAQIREAAQHYLGEALAIRPGLLDVEVDFLEGSLWVRIKLGVAKVVALAISLETIDAGFERHWPETRAKILSEVSHASQWTVDQYDEQYQLFLETMRRQQQTKAPTKQTPFVEERRKRKSGPGSAGEPPSID